MDSHELREKYLEFFREKKHAILPSASLIPEDDPTVLFTTAGMHPLVPFLVGQPHPQGSRLVNCQKCIRTSDIDEVGDSTHLTFFEMLGNWSLGNYFKKEAIEWSYEFLTDPKWLGIDPEHLSVTCFEGDDEVPKDTESAEIWKNLGIPEDRIYFLPREDNWWGPAGETGPCGPDTEMFYDTGKKKCSPDCKPGCSCGKYFEIWNDVFMTYNKTVAGTYEPLKQHNVDTGMGVERTVAILTGKSSIFDVETLAPIFSAIQRQADIEEPTEEQLKSIRIVTDHIKAATFILADDKGVVPSNVEQGYIIRRLIRRAIRQGNLLNLEYQYFSELVRIVIDIYGDTYPELQRNSEFIFNQLEKEGKNFTKSLNRGLRKFNQIFSKKGEITGKDAFLLFTSFGFPIEMTKELAEEQGLIIDMIDFEKEFEEHRKLSRKSTEGKFKSGLADHSEKTTRLHTATHLLQASLRDVLGDHIQQKGSNITKDRTRFDFNHDKKLTQDERERVEQIINEKIEQDLPITRKMLTSDEARTMDILGFFEEEYSKHDKLSVYSVGDYSKELCSGPHVERTSQIGRFRLQKQKKIGTGMIRIYGFIED